MIYKLFSTNLIIQLNNVLIACLCIGSNMEFNLAAVILYVWRSFEWEGLVVVLRWSVYDDGVGVRCVLSEVGHTQHIHWSGACQLMCCCDIVYDNGCKVAYDGGYGIVYTERVGFEMMMVFLLFVSGFVVFVTKAVVLGRWYRWGWGSGGGFIKFSLAPPTTT